MSLDTLSVTITGMNTDQKTVVQYIILASPWLILLAFRLLWLLFCAKKYSKIGLSLQSISNYTIV